MSEPPVSQPRSVLAVLGVLVLVAAVVAGAVLLAQRASDRTATPDQAESTPPSETASVGEAPTPETGEVIEDLPTIDASDFPTETEATGLPTSFPTDMFPTQFPTDASGWDAWASEQMEPINP